MAGVIATATPIACGPALAPQAFAELRRRAMFEWRKWDPQHGDHGTLADFALALDGAAWTELAAGAEALAAEALAAEAELAARPELHGRLGLPRSIRDAMRAGAARPPRQGPRFVRFDFHWTREGWRISEGNTDVPGGFLEADALPALHAAASEPAGDPLPSPADALARAMRARHGDGAPVALLHASAFTDDRQTMLHLRQAFARHGLDARPLAPDALRWHDGEAFALGRDEEAPLSAIFRFYPGEWLPELPRACEWRRLFAGGATPQSNPPSALLVQSKRFPLAWDALRTPLPTWRRLLPETREATRALARDPAWVIKPAMGRVGEDVLVAGATAAETERRVRRAVAWRPWGWAAQRRFESIPIESPGGPVHASIGVFVVDGAAAGAYARVATRPLVDATARECAVAIARPERGANATRRNA